MLFCENKSNIELNGLMQTGAVLSHPGTAVPIIGAPHSSSALPLVGRASSPSHHLCLVQEQKLKDALSGSQHGLCESQPSFLPLGHGQG